ncbi:DAHL domain-containing protein [Rhizobium ruizarguesonis]
MRIAILLIAGLVSMILALSKGPNEENHEAILNAFRSIDLSYAAMQRDVLQAHSGILRNYDFLDQAIERMRADLRDIGALSAAANLDDPAGLDHRLAVMAASIDRNEAMIERFKSGNALIQNSVKIFIRTLSELQARLTDADIASVIMIEQLGQQMWQFQTSGDPALSRAIALDLIALHDMPISPLGDLKKPLVDHGSLILKVLPAVGEIVRLAESQHTIEGSREAQQEYLQQFGRMNAGLSKGRLLLAGISLGLCAYATYLAFCLKFYADRLRWRLHVEQSVNDAVTRLSLEPERFRALMDEALARMAEVFGFHAVTLLTVDPAAWTIQSIFGGDAESGAHMPLAQNFVADLRDRQQPLSDTVLWRHPHYAGLGAFRRIIPRPQPLAVASVAVSHDGPLVMLVGDCRSLRWNRRTDSQILRLTTDLLALAIEKHERLAELERLGRRLEETQRLEAVGTLTGGVAHEFNNILMAMMGYAEMTADMLQPDVPPRPYIDHILSAGQRAKLVVDQMLAFGRMRRNPALPFDVVDAATEMLPVIEVCVAPLVKLDIVLPDEPLAILGSAIELQQILVNLCKNAAEAINGRGHVRLAVDSIELALPCALSHGHLPAGRHVRISIADDGPGIAPGHLQRIFEPFFTTKGDQGGTGLGLSVVHGTIQSLKGAMSVESILGRGTRFNLYFPQMDTAVLPPKGRPEPVGGLPTGDGEIVAIVDPLEASRTMWEEKVAALGYEPLGFASIHQLAAWFLCNRAGLDAALLVGDDGAALPAGLQGLPCVQICTGGGAMPQVPPVSGADRILKMPVSAHSLARAIRAALDTASDCPDGGLASAPMTMGRQL